jgi:hypothetical protein
MTYLANGDRIGESPPVKRVAPLLGSILELALFGLALLFLLPMPSSEETQGGSSPALEALAFWVYCLVGWRRAGNNAKVWFVKATIFTGFAMISFAIGARS